MMTINDYLMIFGYYLAYAVFGIAVSVVIFYNIKDLIKRHKNK